MMIIAKVALEVHSDPTTKCPSCAPAAAARFAACYGWCHSRTLKLDTKGSCGWQQVKWKSAMVPDSWKTGLHVQEQLDICICHSLKIIYLVVPWAYPLVDNPVLHKLCNYTWPVWSFHHPFSKNLLYRVVSPVYLHSKASFDRAQRAAAERRRKDLFHEWGREAFREAPCRCPEVLLMVPQRGVRV